MKYAPRKVYIKESGSYLELSYKGFCRRRRAGQRRMDKLFMPVLEVVWEQYADFYRNKERWTLRKPLSMRRWWTG